MGWYPARVIAPHAEIDLLCLHFAGGGTTMFHSWVQAAPSKLAVIPLLAPGRERRLHEAPLTSITDMAQGCAVDLASHLKRPYAVVGYSMGALVGFELLRLLADSGCPPPVHFFVAAARAPHLPRREQPIAQQPDLQLRSTLKEMGGSSEEILNNDELMQLLLPVIRADFQAVETYQMQAGAPLETPITAFVGEDDPAVAEWEVAQWQQHTRSGFSLSVRPGGHFFIQRSPLDLFHRIFRPLDGAQYNAQPA